MSRARTLRRQQERAQRRQPGDPRRAAQAPVPAPAHRVPAHTVPATAVAANPVPTDMAPSNTVLAGTAPRNTEPADTVTSGPPSAVRLAANRANAQRSTGPRTPEGKTRSRDNAVTHGLFVRHLSQASAGIGELPEELDALAEDLRAEFVPEGREEERIVHRMALAWWRLERLAHLSQRRLAARLAAGDDALQAVLESEQVAVAEARLERSLIRMQRELEFLRRWRTQAATRAATARAHRFAADLEAEAERLLAQARRPEPASAGRPDPLADGDGPAVPKAERMPDPSVPGPEPRDSSASPPSEPGAGAGPFVERRRKSAA